MERGVVGDTSSAGKQREQRGMVVNIFRGRQGREEKRKIRSAGFSLFGATKFIRGKGKKERGQKEGEKEEWKSRRCAKGRMGEWASWKMRRDFIRSME